MEVLRAELDPPVALRVLVHLCLGRTIEQALAALDELAPFELPTHAPPGRALHVARPAYTPSPAALAIQGPLSKWDVAVYLGAAYEALLSANETRRARGAHHTHPDLAREVVRSAATSFSGRERLLRVCDPAVGSGVFLVEALRLFAYSRDVDDWIVQRLFGVDVDAEAVFLARVALYCLSERTEQIKEALVRNIVCDDFVAASLTSRVPWLSEINLFVGNPPWIAYKGRAAAQLDPARRAFLVDSSPAFAGYPTLHGVFIERCARVLPPKGRLGLVVPTSVADLDGYAPTRRAHDRYCSIDPALPDYGASAFEGVFQPAMALLSTARDAPVTPGEHVWELARDDLDDATHALLVRMAGFPHWPAELFGERGIQTTADDRARLSKRSTRRFTQALLSGTEVRPFDLRAAATFVDPADFADRLRTPHDWAGVRLFIRQTARFPIAARGNGQPFRNSILAGFETNDISASALMAFLNATPTRFLHYQRFRDARQGMPQLKIGHLRRLPMPSAGATFLSKLSKIGALIEDHRRAKRDVTVLERELDRLVGDAFALTAVERETIERWSHGPGRVPEPRRTNP